MKTEDLKKYDKKRLTHQPPKLSTKQQVLEDAAKYFENRIHSGIDGPHVAFIIREELIKGRTL